jgi:hypothetical protein
MKFFACLIFASSLFATVNEPLRWEIFSGYRNDRIHWHSEDENFIYSELYRDIEYWENGLCLKVIHRDLTFFLRGSYGTFGRGTVFQRYANLPSSPEQPHFRFQTDGWTADGSGYFGYAVNLTADRMYKFILTPLIGYSGYFEQLRRTQGKPREIEGFSSSLPGNFRLVWNGFLFGGDITIEPISPVVFNLGYSYHLMHNRVHTTIESTLDGVVTRKKLKTSSGGHGGHTGWAQMDCLLSDNWRAGIGGQIHYFFTGVVNASLEETGREDRSSKIKLRWTPVSGWAQISRCF